MVRARWAWAESNPGAGIAVLGLLFCAVLMAAPGPRAAAGEPAPPSAVRIALQTPRDGAVIGGADARAFIAGQALTRPGESAAQYFDLMVVIDRSDSTARGAGTDVNGDGRVARFGCGRGFAVLAALAGSCRTPPDSVLAAELLAVRLLLRQLDPRRTQVGLVSFGGDGRAKTPDAWLGSALTSDFPRLERALLEIEESGPSGFTNMEAAVELALRELAGSERAFSSLDRTPQRVILFLSDGAPTLPVRRASAENAQRAIAAAARAAAAGIRMDTYGIGPEALAQPETLSEMSFLTQGRFTPVMNPRDLPPLFQQLDLAEIAELRVRNLTNRRPAEYLQRGADGSFGALVPLEPGRNRVQVYARSTDGIEQTRELDLEFMREAVTAAVPERWVPMRNRLLESRLDDLREQRDEQLRRGLAERIRETRRRLERRRSVRVEARPGVAAGPPRSPLPEIRAVARPDSERSAPGGDAPNP